MEKLLGADQLDLALGTRLGRLLVLLEAGGAVAGAVGLLGPLLLDVAVRLGLGLERFRLGGLAGLPLGGGQLLVPLGHQLGGLRLELGRDQHLPPRSLGRRGERVHRPTAPHARQHGDLRLRERGGEGVGLEGVLGGTGHDEVTGVLFSHATEPGAARQLLLGHHVHGAFRALRDAVLVLLQAARAVAHSSVLDRRGGLLDLDFGSALRFPTWRADFTTRQRALNRADTRV
ncbi:MAG: hypothetical protein QM765_21475 [Myxococcales bacterium]